ncbi:MAG: hypothetical protein HOY75_08260 [Streptomyces sp.]|nr:hypothetical protein [Streptomyces sp.]
MAPRTRKATSTAPGTPVKDAPAEKQTGRRTRKGTAAKTEGRTLTVVEEPRSAATIVDLRRPLPVRYRTFVGTHTRAQIVEARAALASAMAQLPVPHLLWLTQPNGQASAVLADGTHLIHTHERAPEFTAIVRCPTGGRHAHLVTNAQDLKAARAITRTCTRRHDNTNPGAGGYDWHKAATLGIQQLVPAHLSRLGNGLTTAKAAVADTQPLSEQAIADHIEAQLAHQAEQPKEHPQP